jgi:hypothetical protein
VVHQMMLGASRAWVAWSNEVSAGYDIFVLALNTAVKTSSVTSWFASVALSSAANAACNKLSFRMIQAH